MTFERRISAEESERLDRSYFIEETALDLLRAVHKQVVAGKIADRTEIDDAHLRLRDALNPDYPNNSNWWPEDSTTG